MYWKALLIYVIAFGLAFCGRDAHATSLFDYDVDWTSINSKESILRITIDNCTTKFTVKNKDLETFSKNQDALKDALKKALARANNGCN